MVCIDNYMPIKNKVNNLHPKNVIMNLVLFKEETYYGKMGLFSLWLYA